MTDVPRLETYHFYQHDWEDVDELREWFEWEIPETFNMAEYICDRWAGEKNRVAIFGENARGETETYTFWQLRRLASRLANHFAEQGIGRGDRVAVNTPQRPETIITYIAVWTLGGVVVPLSTRYGDEALRYRISDSGARACVVDESNVDSFRRTKDELENVADVLIVGDVPSEPDEADYWDALERHPAEAETVTTKPDDDAFILYTSGTTGAPKGVRHGHRLLLGNLPQFIATTCDMELSDEDVFWIPVEWAWIGSLFTTVIPALYFGNPVVAYNTDHLNAEAAFETIEKYGVTNFFAPPTAIRMMMKLDSPEERYNVSDLRLLASGGEAVGQSIIDWAAETFDGASVLQGYGQTEAHFFIGEFTTLMDRKPGTMGLPEPGHVVDLVDPDTAAHDVDPGEIGEIALQYEGDPVYFKEYWNKPDKTDSVRVDGWHLTGDLATRDADGYYTFVGRKDDVIISSGYRIGPEEIEESLASHDAVADAGVIGIPDEMKGEVPKAFVIPSEGHDPSDELSDTLEMYVKERLAEFEYPREIEFIDELPLTVTGKVKRTELEKQYQ